MRMIFNSIFLFILPYALVDILGRQSLFQVVIKYNVQKNGRGQETEVIEWSQC